MIYYVQYSVSEAESSSRKELSTFSLTNLARKMFTTSTIEDSVCRQLPPRDGRYRYGAELGIDPDKVIDIPNAQVEANTTFNAFRLSQTVFGEDCSPDGSSAGSESDCQSADISPSRSKFEAKNQRRRERRSEKSREKMADLQMIQNSIEDNVGLAIRVTSPKSAATKIGTWSPGEEKQLIGCLEKGYDERQCADALGRTLQSVRDKFKTSRRKKMPNFQPHDPKATSEAYHRALRIRTLLEVTYYFMLFQMPKNLL